MILLVLLDLEVDSTVWCVTYANSFAADETGISAVHSVCETERIVGEGCSSSTSALDLEGVVVLCFQWLAW